MSCFFVPCLCKLLILVSTEPRSWNLSVMDNWARGQGNKGFEKAEPWENLEKRLLRGGGWGDRWMNLSGPYILSKTKIHKIRKNKLCAPVIQISNGQFVGRETSHRKPPCFAGVRVTALIAAKPPLTAFPAPHGNSTPARSNFHTLLCPVGVLSILFTPEKISSITEPSVPMTRIKFGGNCDFSENSSNAEQLLQVPLYK